MRTLLLSLLIFAAAGCTSQDAATGSASAVPAPKTARASVSASSTLSASSSTSAVPSASASAAVAESAAPEVDEPPPTPIKPGPGAMAANKVTKLGDVGLVIAPPFPYFIKDMETHWNLDDATEVVSGLYVMRKMYSADAPQGDVLPCVDPKEGAAHAEPDGSFTYRCRGRSGNGNWFARLIPTTDATMKTVQCQGSSRSSAVLKQIEATCRSIKKG
ncbi:MAG: hypothetical protein HOW73_48465 [Polyangiaceae bacterium]|nr:hypothetical protein [Polyangiaceae bacterium]